MPILYKWNNIFIYIILLNKKYSTLLPFTHNLNLTMMNTGSKRALIIVGDSVEELDVMVPFYTMQAVGMEV